MLTKLQRAENAWGGKIDLIDQWLNSRRQLLIQYCQIAALAPYDTSNDTLPEANDINNFCNSLVDYVSEGHFEVFQQVIAECKKRDQQSQQLVSQVLPQITDSTELALDFNDKFGVKVTGSDELWLQLDEQLSKLGQALEDRFALEDKMLELLHRQYSEEAQPSS